MNEYVIGVNWSVISSHEIGFSSNICKEFLASMNIFVIVVKFRGLKDTTIL